ncbi:fam-g protein, partial [Plasmodium gallinaceum]
HDHSRYFMNKYTLQIKNKLKDKRVLAEGDISEKKQTIIKEHKEYYPFGEKDNQVEKLVYFINIYSMLYNAFLLLIYELFSKKTNKMSNKCKEQISNVCRNNNSEPYYMTEFSLIY